MNHTICCLYTTYGYGEETLNVCGMGANTTSEDFHDNDVVMKGFDTDSFVGNILVDMYAKCGSIEEAKVVFDRLSERDAFSWNAHMQLYRSFKW